MDRAAVVEAEARRRCEYCDRGWPRVADEGAEDVWVHPDPEDLGADGADCDASELLAAARRLGVPVPDHAGGDV